MSTQVEVDEQALKDKNVPESYIKEIKEGTRNRVAELEEKVCPECGGSVELEEWPDFKCENGHKTNCNFLVESDQFEADTEADDEAEEDEDEETEVICCSNCGTVLTEYNMWSEETCNECAHKLGLDKPEAKEPASLTNRFKARRWRSILENVASLVDEATFNGDGEGLNLRTMDPSHVAMIDLKIGKSFFEDYEFEGKPVVTFDIAQMLVFFKRSSKDEIVSLAYNTDTEKIHLSTTNRKWARFYDLNTLSDSFEEVPTPKLTYTAKIRITSSALRKSIEDLEPISDHLRFEANEAKFRLQADGDYGKMTYDFDKESEELLALEVKDATKAQFSFTYIMEMVKQAAKLSDILTIEYATDMPLKLSCSFYGGNIEYYLAPRVESYE